MNEYAQGNRQSESDEKANLQGKYPGTTCAFCKSPITHTKCIDPTGGNGRFGHRSQNCWAVDHVHTQLLGHKRSTYLEERHKQSVGQLSMIRGIASRS